MRHMTAGRWAIVFGIITVVSVIVPFVIGAGDPYLGFAAMILFVFIVAPISAIIAIVFAVVASFGSTTTAAPDPGRDDPVARMLSEEPGGQQGEAADPQGDTTEVWDDGYVSRMSQRTPFERRSIAWKWTAAFIIAAIATLISLYNLIPFLQVVLGILTFTFFICAACAWLSVAQNETEPKARKRGTVIAATASTVGFVALIALTAQAVTFQAYRDDLDALDFFEKPISDWRMSATLDLAEACLGQQQRGEIIDRVERISNALPEGSFPEADLAELRDAIPTARARNDAFDKTVCEEDAQRFTDALAAIGADATELDWEEGWGIRDLYVDADVDPQPDPIPQRSLFTLTPRVAKLAAERAEALRDDRDITWDAQHAAGPVLGEARAPLIELLGGPVAHLADTATIAVKQRIHDAGIEGTPEAEKLTRLAERLDGAGAGDSTLEALEAYAEALAAL